MRGKPLPPEKVDEIRRLRQDGLTLHKIAERVGVSLETVRKYQSDAKVEHAKRRYEAWEARRRQSRRRIGAPAGRHAIKTTSPIMRELFLHIWRNDMKHEQVARQIGISTKTLTDWKRGYNAPSMLLVEAMAQVLGYELVLRKRDV